MFSILLILNLAKSVSNTPIGIDNEDLIIVNNNYQDVGEYFLASDFLMKAKNINIKKIGEKVSVTLRLGGEIKYEEGEDPVKKFFNLKEEFLKKNEKKEFVFERGILREAEFTSEKKFTLGIDGRIIEIPENAKVTFKNNEVKVEILKPPKYGIESVYTTYNRGKTSEKINVRYVTKGNDAAFVLDRSYLPLKEGEIVFYDNENGDIKLEGKKTILGSLGNVNLGNVKAPSLKIVTLSNMEIENPESGTLLNLFGGSEGDEIPSPEETTSPSILFDITDSTHEQREDGKTSSIYSLIISSDKEGNFPKIKFAPGNPVFQLAESQYVSIALDKMKGAEARISIQIEDKNILDSILEVNSPGTIDNSGTLLSVKKNNEGQLKIYTPTNLPEIEPYYMTLRVFNEKFENLNGGEFDITKNFYSFRKIQYSDEKTIGKEPVRYLMPSFFESLSGKIMKNTLENLRENLKEFISKIIRDKSL